MSTTNISAFESPLAKPPNVAGPVLRSGDVALAVLDAAREDNPGKEIFVSDHTAYIRVEAEGGLTVKRKTIEEMLGRPFRMQELEVNLTGFSGKIEMTVEYTRWYFLNTAGAKE
jgi:toluene monooxygenase system protein D